jgi:hypothetical protein
MPINVSIVEDNEQLRKTLARVISRGAIGTAEPRWKRCLKKLRSSSGH